MIITSTNLSWEPKTVVLRPNSRATGNSTYKKFVVQCLNEAFCFIANSVVVEINIIKSLTYWKYKTL